MHIAQEPQKRPAQREFVLSHIERHGSINSIEAIRHYGITRLARVVNEMAGTLNALKAEPDETLGRGFVRYVPDDKERASLLKARTLHDLIHADSPDEVIDVLAAGLQDCLRRIGGIRGAAQQ